MAWEARKYKDIIDTLTGNLMQLELNIRVIGGYLNVLENKTCNQLLEATRDNIKDLKGTTEALQNTIKDNNYELSKVLEVE